VSTPLVALTLQPDDEGAAAAVFGFDMLRTWWNTNQWRREARRRRRETS
jgi:hypothetical protein